MIVVVLQVEKTTTANRVELPAPSRCNRIVEARCVSRQPHSRRVARTGLPHWNWCQHVELREMLISYDRRAVHDAVE